LLAIVYFVTSIVAAFTVPRDGTPKRRLDAETVKRLDLPGTGLTVLGIGMFCAALRYVLYVGLRGCQTDYGVVSEAMHRKGGRRRMCSSY